MTIELKEPEMEELIRLRMDTGLYASVDEVLLDALRSAPVRREASDELWSTGTGLDLIAAMQTCPFPDLDVPRFPMPSRDVVL